MIKEFGLVCGVGLLLCGVLADSPAWAIGGGALMLYFRGMYLKDGTVACSGDVVLSMINMGLALVLGFLGHPVASGFIIVWIWALLYICEEW